MSRLAAVILAAFTLGCVLAISAALAYALAVVLVEVL